MNNNESVFNEWRCGYCSFTNDDESTRCVICMKSRDQKSQKNDYPKLFHLASEIEFGYNSNAEHVILFGSETNKDEELEVFERADRDNFIIALANEENVSLAQAKVAVALMDLDYSRESAVDASKQCSNFEAAQAFLNRLCPICDCFHPQSKMESMYYCEHSVCILCAKQYFTQQVKDRNVLDIVCPVCRYPKLGESLMVEEYFAMSDAQFKRILDDNIYQLLQTKLVDHCLSNDPEFFWCSNCKDSFGFFIDTRQPLFKITCPRCRISFCSKCKSSWERNHDCSTGKKSESVYTSDLENFLNHNYIKCPKCGVRYDMVRGGCIHFTCSWCKHSWCNGCQKTFHHGTACGISDKCLKRGLHAHHPRNCFYFGRDKDYKILQQLLRNNGVHFDIKPLANGLEKPNLCPVLESKDESCCTENVCGKPVEEGLAGLCTEHYREYLSRIIQRANLDPVDIMDTQDLVAELERNDVNVPGKSENETDVNYYHRLKKIVVDTLPLQRSSSI